MLESVFVQGGQSHGISNIGKLAESRRWHGWSRRHFLFFILVLGVVLFFYSTDIKEMAPDWSPKWWRQYNSSKWWIPFESVVVPHMRAPGPASDLKTPDTGSSSHHRAENITSAKVTNKTDMPGQTAVTPVVQPAPVPYVSPGPYLVEYPYEYYFIINEPNKCEQQKPFLVLVVPVAPHNRAHRDIIRSTWGSERVVQDRVVTLVFLLGRQTGEETEQLQKQLLQESKEHHDLIQSDFVDCYKNLTIKTMVMLEWLSSHCSSASYTMKIDSDMFLNVHNLINMLLNAPKTNYMTGLVARGGVVLRDPKSKWYLPVELYPHSQYPRYALGLGYILSLDLPKKLVDASRHIKALYIEDVYLGLCMQHLGIPPTDPPNWGYFNVFPVAYSRCAYSKLVATTTNEYVDRVWVWKDFKKTGSYC